MRGGQSCRLLEYSRRSSFPYIFLAMIIDHEKLKTILRDLGINTIRSSDPLRGEVIIEIGFRK